MSKLKEYETDGDEFFAEVALPIPIYDNFTYSVPPDMAEKIALGSRVIVPFGNTFKTGVVVDFAETTEIPKVKAIIDIADEDPPLATHLMELCKWIAEYYLCPLGEVFSAAHPAGMLAESKKAVRLTSEMQVDLVSTDGYDEEIAGILRRLTASTKIPLDRLRKDFSSPGLLSRLNKLQKRGIIEIYNDLPRTSLKPKTERLLYLNPEISSDNLQTWLSEREGKAPKQASVVRYLRNSPPVSRKTVQIETGASLTTINSLLKQSIISEKIRQVIRESTDLIDEKTKTIVHTRAQKEAISQIVKSLSDDKFTPFLIHGVAGSGKTEIYLEVIKHCLDKGRSALVLVPEIALTPQISSRFRRKFGGQVVVLHSRISAGERYDSWKRLASGSARVAIGARSALFAPLINLGLIVVDEEHEPSFKQMNRPHYNARDCAIVLAQKLSIPVVLGSATPAVETYENARQLKYSLLELPERVAGMKFSQIHLVDLSKKENHIGDTDISPLMMDKIEDQLNRGDKTIILQNRRGFSTFLKCLHCGAIDTCINCSVTLTYHSTNRRMRCHLCGFQKRAPDICPECGSTEILYCGSGTQKVEDELYTLFPDARIARMDLDTTAGVDSHFNILDRFQKGEYDILLGTQMVAKGLDFPDVTLVGIINADTELLFPDFRAEERTFRLLTQAAGRSGRHRPGEVVVQTYNPDHKIFDYVESNDYHGFFVKTLRERMTLHYPPYGRIIALRISSPVEATAADTAIKIAERLKSEDFLILGPSPALLSRVKRRYYFNVLIKIRKPSIQLLSDTKRMLLSSREELMKSLGQNNIAVDIDIDPVNFH